MPSAYVVYGRCQFLFANRLLTTDTATTTMMITNDLGLTVEQAEPGDPSWHFATMNGRIGSLLSFDMPRTACAAVFS